MKSILYIANEFNEELPNGASIIINEQIKELKKKHNVTFLNFKVTIKLPTEYTMIKDEFGILNFPNLIEDLDKDYDFVILTNPLQQKLIPRIKTKKIYYIVNNSDLQSTKHKSSLTEYEIMLLKQTDINIFLTTTDFLYYKSLNLIRNKDLVLSPFIEVKEIHQNRNLNTALLTTNLNYEHNKESLQWFFENVYKQLSSNLELTITGLGDFDALKVKYPKVKFLEFVTRKEIEKLYLTKNLYINPTIKGSGIQVKLLEALSYGMNAISTEYSNPFKHILLSSDNPVEFANLINKYANTNYSNFNFEEYNKSKILEFNKLFD
jgi:nucleoid DNA-binding protein